MSSEKKEWVISYAQLGLLVLIFCIGVISALLVSNSQIGETTTFTTTELIGFLLSVILSGASIVLAVTAITLGKSSEQSVIKRSDESIRLQNEVFIKTTEALQRIEASTGVTEKRIEDIISGRVGDISHKVAEKASGGKRSQKDIKELEENIRRSLMETFREEQTENRLEDVGRELVGESPEDLYQDAHTKILLSIANDKGVEAQKIGHGTVPNKGDDLFDGIYVHNNIRAAISTFRPYHDDDILNEYIACSARELIEGNIQKVALVIFTDNESPADRANVIESALGVMKDELSSNFIIKFVKFEDYEEVSLSLRSELWVNN